VRVYETLYRRLRPALFAGGGFHYGVHSDTHPGEGAEPAWDTSPYVAYSTGHGLPVDSQASGGLSANLLVDSRDSAINPRRGWLAQANYRAFMKDFLGGDSTWQELYLDARTYFRPGPRQTLAFWFRGDLVTGGTAPYFDLPATGMDTFGRSARGYTEGRFRGERLLYGEVEYRATLTANGLLGAVAFVNTTTITNLQTGEKLFDSFATGAGVGLRVLMDKRSRTNLCLDIGWGKDGSHGVYLAIQEAF
jgi:outer membrane protein assembly factor BamA